MAESFDLGKLQARLNEDPELKRRFLDSPVETLTAEGLELTSEQKNKVAFLVDRIKKPGATVEGAGIAPAELEAITITISIDF